MPMSADEKRKRIDCVYSSISLYVDGLDPISTMNTPCAEYGRPAAEYSFILLSINWIRLDPIAMMMGILYV